MLFRHHNDKKMIGSVEFRKCGFFQSAASTTQCFFQQSCTAGIWSTLLSSSTTSSNNDMSSTMSSPPKTIPQRKNVLTPFLSSAPHVVILDGGLSTSLPNDAQKHFFWGHQLLYGLDGGLDVLKDVHRSFLDNGADIIGTLTYKLSAELIDQVRERGMLDSFPAETRNLPVDVLFERSIGTALKARDEFWAKEQQKQQGGRKNKPLVFASCGSFVDATMLFRGATDPNTRSDGSEDEAPMRAYYERKLKSITDVGVDGVAIETLAGSREAVLAAEIVEKLEIPAWISFCCQDEEHTISGEKLADCAETLLLATKSASIQAVGVNCIHPNLAPSLVGILHKTIEKLCSSGANMALNNNKPAIVVYPNSGEKWDASAEKRCWHSQEGMKYLTGEDAIEYKNAGANVIGGCCRVTPKQIGLFRDSLRG